MSKVISMSIRYEKDPDPVRPVRQAKEIWLPGLEKTNLPWSEFLDDAFQPTYQPLPYKRMLFEYRR